MKDVEFGAAIWGYSWEEVPGNVSTNLQGSVSLSREGLVLDIPFGSLLAGRTVSVPLVDQKPREVKCLYGFSRKGECCALLDPVVSHMTISMPGAECQSIKGNMLLVGKREFDPFGKVSHMSVRMTGLREWVVEFPFSMSFTSDYRALDSIKYDYENASSYTKTLYSADDLTVGIHHRFTMDPLTVAGANLEHDCVLDIEFIDARDMDNALAIVLSLSRFFSFCLGYYAEIQAIELRYEGSEAPVSLYSNFMRGAEPTKEEIRQAPVTLPVVEADIEAILKCWLHADGEFETACSMVSSLISRDWDIPLDLKFLAASQAFEVLTKIGAELESLPQETFERYRNIVLGPVEDKEVKNWLRGKLSGNRKGSGKLIREALSRYGELADWLLPDQKTFVDRHQATRNFYTHRSESRGDSSRLLKDSDLYWHTETLLVLCMGIIWVNLGVTAERFIEAMQRSRFKSFAVEQAKELYSRSDAVG